jgi:putative salt-induced outer membrane protein
MLTLLATAAQPAPIVVNVPPPPAAALPSAIRALIDAAIANRDAASIAAIFRFARQTNPLAVAQIDAMEAEYDAQVAEEKARAARERADALASASFLDNWRGEVELGASRSTGNTRNLGLYAAFKLTREGLEWRHAANGRIDYQETDEAPTAERVLASWQSSYKIDEAAYAYGIAQFERDRFLGVDSRFTLGGGAGYTLVSSREAKLTVEGGPAARRTRYNRFSDERGSETTLAARASVNLDWQVTPTLKLTQASALYVEADNTNASATTALDTKLIGALKARLSYNVQYESNVPGGNETIDTLSRATLVYSF